MSPRRIGAPPNRDIRRNWITSTLDSCEIQFIKMRPLRKLKPSPSLFHRHFNTGTRTTFQYDPVIQWNSPTFPNDYSRHWYLINLLSNYKLHRSKITHLFRILGPLLACCQLLGQLSDATAEIKDQYDKLGDMRHNLTDNER